MAKIVILDDQNEICQTLQNRLANDGHEVRTATNGEDAIDLGHLFQPDLLITDWDLESDYDGYEVAEAVRYAQANVKTILITGYLARATSNFKFNAKIPKPFSFDTLVSTVNWALRSSY